MNPLLSCIHNPAAGKEKEMAELEPALKKKRVMVIGGGPGGLETARVAALRGHQVSLYERGEALGGQVCIAARGPGREGMAKLTKYLENQIHKLGVEVNRGVEATPELVEAKAPDAVVIATGSVPSPSEIPGSKQENVFDVRQVLRGQVQVGQKVVIIDEEGSYKAASVAELLADEGREVEIVTRDPFISPKLAPTQDLIPWYQRAFSKGITLTPQTTVRRIDKGTVEVSPNFSDKLRRIEGVGTVILALYDLPNQGLYLALKRRIKELYRVGDCLAPRRISHAILDGNRIGRIL